jgi:hypothetical protein
MPPKRIADTERSESPRKRAKKTASSQKSIESFFSKGKTVIKNTRVTKHSSHIAHSQPSSISKLSPEVIIIDSSEEDDDSDVALGAAINKEAANPVVTPPPPDIGIASSSGSSEITNDVNRMSKSIPGSRPGGPTILSSVELVKHVTGGKHIPMIISDTLRVSPRLPTIEKPRTGVALEPSLDSFAIQPFPDLTTDPLLFDPCLELDHSPWWPQGAPAPYALLVHALQALASTRSRIAILSIVTNALRVLIAHDPPSVLPTLYLLSNSLSPPWEGIELGAGGSVISKVCFIMRVCKS